MDCTMKREKGEKWKGQKSDRKCPNFILFYFFQLQRNENFVQCVYYKTRLAYHRSTTLIPQHPNRKPPVHGTDPTEGNINISINFSLPPGCRRLQLPVHLPAKVCLMTQDSMSPAGGWTGSSEWHGGKPNSIVLDKLPTLRWHKAQSFPFKKVNQSGRW